MDARVYGRGNALDNTWRWFLAGILVGLFNAALVFVVIDPLHLDDDAEASSPVERTFVIVVDESGRVVSQRVELTGGETAPPPAVPEGPPDAEPAAAEPTAAPTPEPTPLLGLGRPVMARVDQPSYLAARDGVAYVATNRLEIRRVNLEGEVSTQSVEGIRDLGRSRIVDLDVVSDGAMYALVVDGPLEWRLFRRAASGGNWTQAASSESVAWPADVVALSAADSGAVYLSAADPAGVFRLEPDMATLRPWVAGERALGLEAADDDARLLFASPETSPARPAEQVRIVERGAVQRWLTSYPACPAPEGAAARATPGLPRDVALLPPPSEDGLEAALVVDSSNHVVWYQERFGEGRPLFGVPCESGSDEAHLSGPRAVAVDNRGNVFIADPGNGRVVVLPKAPAAGPGPA